MIERLRRRFIATAMLAVVIVLTLIMLAVNISDIHIINKNADEILAVLCENGGVFPDTKPDGTEDPVGKDNAEVASASSSSEDPVAESSTGSNTGSDGTHDGKDGSSDSKVKNRSFYSILNDTSEMNEETPYATRYFSILLDDNGNTMSINTGRIASVSSSEALEMAQQVRQSNRSSGYYSTYRYKTTETASGTLYIFLDRSGELVSAVSLLLMSLIIYVSASLLIFLLILLLSKRILRPMEESYAKQKEFITNAGHELKTPLAIIDSCTEVIEMEQGESKWTSGIHEQVERLAGMTKNLIGLARMDEASLDIEMKNFDLSKAVAETLQPFTLMAEEHGLKLDLDIADGIELFGNERTLKQLSSILADNAVKYASPGTEIRMKLQKKGRRIYLSSENRADGIAKGSHSEYFDRFYRGDSSHNSAQAGYGIGLSMARSIVESHGGRISAESPDGMSLRITAQMPDRLAKERNGNSAGTGSAG